MANIFYDGCERSGACLYGEVNYLEIMWFVPVALDGTRDGQIHRASEEAIHVTYFVRLPAS